MKYFDYQATTPCDPRVLETMMPYFTEFFGNPHSRNHQYGWDAENAVEIARAHVAKLIGAHSKDVVFTSGATESNNLAIKGIAWFYKKPHIITCATEHKCVLDTCRFLETENFRITYLPVQKNGLIDLNQLADSITSDTCLVSIMAVNNELGVIQPIKEIGALCRLKNVWFHTDAAQAFGKIHLHVDEMNIDLMSISGHKIYGPKGIGALYVRRNPRVRLQPLIHGGGQERGLRPGTLPTPLCVGLGEAARIAKAEMQEDAVRIQGLTKYFYDNIMLKLSDVYLNGDLEKRVPGNLNLSFACVEGEGLMMSMEDLAVSSGSACTSSSLEPSYVLRSLGVSEELAHTSIRFGFGRFTTKEEVEEALASVIHGVERLRALSPLWDMKQQGIDLSSIQWDKH